MAAGELPPRFPPDEFAGIIQNGAIKTLLYPDLGCAEPVSTPISQTPGHPERRGCLSLLARYLKANAAALPNALRFAFLTPTDTPNAQNEE